MRLGSFQSIIIAVLSVFLLLPGQALGTVLCIGADGHIALEIAKNGRCGDLSSVSPSEHITPMSQNTDHCGVCVDVSLSASNSDGQQIFSAQSASLKLDAPHYFNLHRIPSTTLCLTAFISCEHPHSPSHRRAAPLNPRVFAPLERLKGRLSVGVPW
jgi:hypothetical protein